METNNYINQLILKYLEGNISMEEGVDLENWLQESKVHQGHLDELQAIWIASEAELHLSTEVIGKEWGKLESRHFSIAGQSGKWRKWIQIAAVFAVGALLSWGISTYRYNSYFSQLKESVITAPLGAKSTISLPDGTTVILNAGSVLKYSGDFGKNIREVSLEGEAFFEVAKNKSKLFQVRTSDVTVKAYGTKFNVKSYGGEKTIETTLVEGSVSVVKNKSRSGSKGELFLKPREQLIFYKATPPSKVEEKADSQPQSQAAAQQEPQTEKVLVSRGIDPLLFTSWTEDRLIMKSEPMQKMVIKLERKYNVKIYFEDVGLRDFRFSGIIENETLENVLAAISIASPVEYTLKDREIWLRKKSLTSKN